MLEWKQPGSTVDDEDEDYSAVEVAIERGQGKLFKLLRPDRAKDDFNRLYCSTNDPDTLDFLIGLRPPDDWLATILRNVFRITSDIYADRAHVSRWCWNVSLITAAGSPRWTLGRRTVSGVTS